MGPTRSPSRVGDARRHLEEGIALARRIDRPWVEIACRGHLAIEAAELMEHFQWIDIAESRSLRSQPQKLAAVRDELADVLAAAAAGFGLDKVGEVLDRLQGG